MTPYEKANEKAIRSALLPCFKNINIILVDETDSTNEQMKKYARQGQSEIRVLIAESQSAGKGTKGRSFYSPDSTGCYMSFLFRPTYPPELCTLLTAAAAAATAEAIEAVTEKSVGIKWVNDIILDGRKVAGILTESSIKKDLTGLDWAVVGIGINITEPEGGFPEEIRNIAGAISQDVSTDIKNRLVAEIINRFTEYYCSLDKKNFMESYRNRLFFLGNKVTVTQTDKICTATAVDIDPMCRLIIETADGERKTLHAGEISVRPL